MGRQERSVDCQSRCDQIKRWKNGVFVIPIGEECSMMINADEIITKQVLMKLSRASLHLEGYAYQGTQLEP